MALQHLKLLTAAVAGRTVAVAHGPQELTWTDGETIFVPEHAGDLARDALIVQAALIAAGSLAPRIVARTAGRRRLRQRYLTLETMRAAAALDGVVPRSVARRVDALYAGAVPASPEESLRRAGSAERVPEAPAWLGEIKPSRILRQAGGLGGGAPTRDQVEQSSGADPFDDPDDEGDRETSRLLELLSAPTAPNPISEALQKLLGAGRTPRDDGSGGDEMPASGSRVARVGRNAKTSAATPDVDLGLQGPPVGRRYPEWDWGGQRYKHDWCAVQEYDPHIAAELTDLDPGDDPRLRRALARLGLAHERHRRKPDGDALDVTALIEYTVDRTTGTTADDRVYEVKRRTGHDLGVVVLLDITGSTGDSESGLRVFDEQRQIAARLIATLDGLGDRVAGYGFQSWGRNGVRFVRIKDFDDRYDLAAQQRLASLEPGGFTRLGAAVRHGTHLLTDRAGTINTLLIVVGDGLPYDDGYEHRYAQEDSRLALTEAVGAGVGCACVSVMTATDDDVLERVWGHVPYIKLARVSDLHRQVMPVFRRGLREAAAGGRDARSAPTFTTA